MKTPETVYLPEKEPGIKLEYKYTDPAGAVRDGPISYQEIHTFDIPEKPVWARLLDVYIHTDYGDFAVNENVDSGLRAVDMIKEFTQKNDDTRELENQLEIAFREAEVERRKLLKDQPNEYRETNLKVSNKQEELNKVKLQITGLLKGIEKYKL